MITGKDLILIAKNYRKWRDWRKIKNGVKTVDLKRGAGYYFPVLLFHNPIGMIEEMKMESGKIGLFELLSFKSYQDPWDMIEESYWHFIGYKGEKLIKDCSFREALEIYCKKSTSL